MEPFVHVCSVRRLRCVQNDVSSTLASVTIYAATLTNAVSAPSYTVPAIALTCGSVAIICRTKSTAGTAPFAAFTFVIRPSANVATASMRGHVQRIRGRVPAAMDSPVHVTGVQWLCHV